MKPKKITVSLTGAQSVAFDKLMQSRRDALREQGHYLPVTESDLVLNMLLGEFERHGIKVGDDDEQEAAPPQAGSEEREHHRLVEEANGLVRRLEVERAMRRNSIAEAIGMDPSRLSKLLLGLVRPVSPYRDLLERVRQKFPDLDPSEVPPEAHANGVSS